ncbi:Wzz/FepE/Etk N-terminal domain-containing protein [Pedobacter alpinus]|uniref:Wzz/FepE/Etk N-terminal domain-containing protein n=1 Tax=Pedobacter alpinus TaxID=1590643 RepID=A0ABW5TPP3_9SPHI
MPNNQANFDLVDVIKLANKYRLHIFLITFFGALIGLILAFVITPKYEAYTTFYIPGNNSISQSLLADNNLENFMSFGDEEQIDQTLELLNSDHLKDKVINQFNLTAHYGIDAAAKFPKTKARAEFKDNVEFKRTDFLAIKILVKDVDAVLAANMANYILVCLDSMRSQIQQIRGEQAYGLIKLAYKKKQTEVDSILKQLSQIRAKGIFDYEAQSEVLSEAIVKAQTQVKAEEARVKVYESYQSKLPDTTIIRAKGKLAAAIATYQSLQPTVANFGKLSGKYLELEAVYKKEQESLSNLQLRFEAAELDYKGFISQRFLVEKAIVPEKSKYPNKMLMVFLFALSAFLISLFTICYINFIAPSFKN